MSWLMVVVAGLLESVQSLGLKYTEGFTRPPWTSATQRSTSTWALQPHC
jgi:multidrug transporter EmrE-like cation transporter